MDFVTLGMFIIDEIHHQPPRQPDLNVMGGAGLYATLGARLFRPPPSSTKVGWVVHRGHDFPSSIKETIDSWDTSCRLIETPDRPTTRAWNRYEPDGYRSFKYLNERTRVDENCLTEKQLMSKTYHLICSADRCVNLVQGIRTKRRELVEGNTMDERSRHTLMKKPVFIWEPLPALCIPSKLQQFVEALKFVDVVSPNLEEFCSLLNTKIDLEQPSGWSLLSQKCKGLIDACSEISKPALVVRLGEKGCYVAQLHRYLKLPAYYEQDAASRVVDPTGGGNTFLGGFGIGVVQHAGSSRLACFEEAAVYGMVAASFAIEQTGVPTLTQSSSQGEIWNGEEVKDRLEKYRRRIGQCSE